MDDTARSLCRLIEGLAAATGRKASTVSRLTSGSGDTYARLRAGKRITTERAGRIARAISERWPEHQTWPSDIPRPQAPDASTQDAA